MEHIIIAVAAFLLGSTLVFLLGASYRARNGAEAARLAEQSGQLQHSLGQAQAKLADIGSQLMTSREEVAQSTERARRVPALETRCRELEEELRTAVMERAELATQLENDRKQTQEKVALLNEAKEEMADRFKNLANDILEEKSKKFASQNENSLRELLDPLKSKLGEFQTMVKEAYVDESKDRSALAQQVTDLTHLNQQLSQQAHDLTSALKGSAKIQGNWGELLLEKILEGAGLREGHEYDVQGNFTHVDGSRGQPDVVLNLPEKKHIVIDSKVSLNAYSDYASTNNDADRESALDRHITSIRAHIKGLSAKGYQDLLELNSLDFVIMFIPIEAAFALAVSTDPELWRDAYRKNVLLVSPINLLYVLRTISNVWRAEVQRQKVADIVKRGAELYDKFAGFVESMQTIGYRLEQAQVSYGEAMTRLTSGRGNLLRQAEQLKEFGIKPKKNLPEPLLEADRDELADGLERDGESPVQLKMRSLAASAHTD